MADGDDRPSEPGRKLRPYYQEARAPTPEWRAELRKLVGFDVATVRRNLHDWLYAAGFEQRDVDGCYAGMENVPDDVRTATTDLQRQACAVRTVFRRLLSLERMWGAERVAWMRWKRALDTLREALTSAEEYASVRADEDSYFLGHVVGEHGRENYGRRLNASKSVLDGVRELAGRIDVAQGVIVRYSGDLLPGVDARGRWSKDYLASIEADLNDGKFSYAALAPLTDDGSAGAEQRVRQRVERFRKDQPGSEEG